MKSKSSRRSTSFGRPLLLVALLLIALGPVAARSETVPLTKKVVFIAVDNVGLTELKEANDPNFNRLIERSSIGLLNLRVNKSLNRAKEYVSVSSSARADAPDGALAFNSYEPFEHGTAGEAYERRTGNRAPENGVVALSIGEVLAKNKKLNYKVVPGSLGQALTDAGKKVAVLGSSDISLYYRDKNFSRDIAYMAMNENGSVALGNVGKSLLIADPSAPFGIRTDESLLLKEFDKFYFEADFIAIDFGDTARADAYAAYSTEKALGELKRDAIKRAGRFVEKVRRKLGPGDVLMVASLTPPGKAAVDLKPFEEKLTPIMVYVSGNSGSAYAGKLLTSESTHQEGLVTNLDIAPTILSSLGIDLPYTMFGRAFKYVPGGTGADDRVDRLIKFSARASGVNSAREGIIASFAATIAVTLAGTLLALLLKEKYELGGLRWFLKVSTLSVIAFPLSSFILAYYLGTAPSLILILAIPAGAFAMAIAAQAICKNGLRPAALLSAAMLLMLGIDMLTGGRFSIDTVFGYDSIVGGRFYGIGNEGMSVAIGALMIVFAMLGRIEDAKWRNAAILSSGIAIAALVSLPQLGSNLGGVPAVLTAVLTFVAVSGKRKAKPYAVALGFVAIALGLALVIVIDVLSGSSTHIGRTAQLVQSGGLAELWLISKRRISENASVFMSSAWSYVLLVIVPIAATLRYRPVGLLYKVFKNHPTIAAGFSAALLSGIVGFLIEDSGIVIPAIILAQYVPLVVYMMLSEGWKVDG